MLRLFLSVIFASSLTVSHVAAQTMPFNSVPQHHNQHQNNNNDDNGAGAALAGILLLGLGAAAVAAASSDDHHHRHHHQHNNPWGPGPNQPPSSFSPAQGVYCYPSDRQCFVNGQYNYYWSHREFP